MEKTMNLWVYDGFGITYKALGVDFDKFLLRNQIPTCWRKDIVEEGLKKGVFFKKDDGSVWIDLTPDGLDEKLVLRADGTSVYMTQDLGTLLKYNDYHMDESIYVVVVILVRWNLRHINKVPSLSSNHQV